MGSEASTGLSPAEVRALALEAGFTEAGLVALPHAAEERDAARFEEWVRAGARGRCATWSGASEARASCCGRGWRFRFRGRGRRWFALRATTAGSRARPSRPRRGGMDCAVCVEQPRRMPKGERRPSDYHKVLLKRLKALEARLQRVGVGEFEARGYVDTGPVVERALATAAGLGWTGKNTCLIHPKLGSFGFLAVLLTSLEVEEESALAALVRTDAGVQALPGGLPDGGAGCALPDGCDAMHLLLDDRAQGGDCRGVDGGDGAAGVWLRHLPGCLPVERAGERR